mmetsp:Transcript_15713/g.41576  ORF Transcript_15713/g.41576 Transcript_15713/m.41576 type:complete len:232 (+) Transcript_15713:782-1477(+)
MPVICCLAACIAATSWEKRAMSSVSCVIVALPFSASAVRRSRVSDSFSREILLLPISLSQKPSCSASPWASSRSLAIMPEIIFLNLPKGSASSFWARRPSSLLCKRAPSRVRKSRTRTRMPWARSAAEPCWLPAPLICTRLPPLATCARPRCFAAEAWRSSEERISTAFARASISSARSVCFSPKESLFSLHSTEVSWKVDLSSASTLCVDCSCFLSSADASCLPSLLWVM